MSTLRQQLREVRQNIAEADSLLLLDGMKYPRGRFYNLEEDAVGKRESSIAIIQAYNLLKETGKNYPKLLNHLYYLARDVYQSEHDDYILRVSETPTEVRDQIKAIAGEGRQIHNSPGISIERRSTDSRLFVIGDNIFPAQIRDSKRGCSASICTNCFEPIAYSTQKCRCCNFELIGPFGFPEIEVWQKLSEFEKRRLVEKVYCSNNHGKLGVLVKGELKKVVLAKIRVFNISRR